MAFSGYLKVWYLTSRLYVGEALLFSAALRVTSKPRSLPTRASTPPFVALLVVSTGL
jgi:hypothetical protein